ncbi:MAG: prolipoprotein diacylglyceryl transferase [Cloacibacillus sp.]
MHPVIFKISFLEARSYYVLWASALLLFIFWTRRRAERLYGIDYDDASSVLIWVYCAGILGSYAASVAGRLPLYFSGEMPLSMVFRGMTSWGGMAAGGVVGLYRLKRLRIRAGAFADAAALPAAAMLAIGRVGCHLEGCCAGVGRYYEKAPLFGLHFPFDAAGYYHFPSQLLESSAAFAIFLILLMTQRLLKKCGRLSQGGVLFPIFLALYGLYRFCTDGFRAAGVAGVSQSGDIVWLAAMAIGASWLVWTLRGFSTPERRDQNF